MASRRHLLANFKSVPTEKTVASWAKLQTWLKYVVDKGNDVKQIYCSICIDHSDAIKYFQNFSEACIGKSIKKTMLTNRHCQKLTRKVYTS